MLPTKKKLFCLLNFQHKCFDCSKQLCSRHYNYYSKKAGVFRGCTDYGKADESLSRPYGFCPNEVCSSCSKKVRVRVGYVKCRLHAPNFSPDAPKVFRCPDYPRYGLYEEHPLEDFKKHLETCKRALDKHYVGIKGIHGEHQPAKKTDL